MLDRVEAKDALTEIAGVRLELIRRGQGRPLLFLHPAIGLKPADAVLDELAKTFSVLAPSHPGFGKSELPRHITTVDDLAYFYLDLMDALDLRDVMLAGVSFGGWIAAEIAIKSTERVSRLVLADAVGIKVGDREHRDIVDIFTTRQSEIDQLAFHDPTVGAVDHAAISDEDAATLFRNREAAALFALVALHVRPEARLRACTGSGCRRCFSGAQATASPCLTTAAPIASSFPARGSN